MKNLDAFVGMLGFGVGLIGIGYAIGAHSKMARISENLDRSIEDLASKTPVDIPEDMIKCAAEKAVAYEVKQAVKKVTDTVIADIKKDIHRQVSDVVEAEYSDIKDTVLESITEEASKIDARRVRSDVERAAKERALKKFDDNLDDILEDYKANLDNVSRIYKRFADAATPSNSGGTVLRIG